MTPAPPGAVPVPGVVPLRPERAAAPTLLTPTSTTATDSRNLPNHERAAAPTPLAPTATAVLGRHHANLPNHEHTTAQTPLTPTPTTATITTASHNPHLPNHTRGRRR